MVVVDVFDKRLYIDDGLKSDLDRIKANVLSKDEDRFFVVDGREGSGKSVLTLQLAAYLDSSFCLDRVVFSAESFEKAIIDSKKGDVIVFDEAFRGLSSKGALSKMNKVLVRLMMECRQKNLIVFIVLPTFFLLERYVAIFRASGLFHVYRNKKGDRGFWMFFNYSAKKKLYMHGLKSYWSYDFPASSFKGRFLNVYCVDEAKYRSKKLLALRDSFDDKAVDKFEVQRNFLLCYLHRELKVSTVELAGLLSADGFRLSQQGVSKAIKKYEDDNK